MSDDWEDWEETTSLPALKPAAAANEKTKGESLLQKDREIDESRFAGEDEGEEEEPKWKSSVPKTQQVFNDLCNKASFPRRHPHHCLQLTSRYEKCKICQIQSKGKVFLFHW